MLLWCLFVVSGIVPKVLKMFVFFPVWGGFCGVGYFCSFGFRRFRCFGVFVFVFCVGFVSVLFALFFVVGLFLVLVLVLFCLFVFVFVCFCFWGRVWATSPGPKPSLLYLFYCFVFCFFV